MKKFITILTAVCLAAFGIYVVDLNLSVIRGAFAYNLLIVAALFIAFDFTLTISEILEEEKQERAAKGKTSEEWDFEFSDPEIEAMWNRAYFFASRGMEIPKGPKGFISGKEES